MLADFPDLGQAGYPAEVGRTGGVVVATVDTPAGALVLKGREDGRAFSGDWSFGEMKGRFTAATAKTRRRSYREQPVRFRSEGGPLLSGVVLTPDRPGRHPGFVGLHGSGAETRAGANRFLAEHLAAKGAVVLLFDKRGSGESEGDWRTATLEDLAADARAALEVLRGRMDVDAARIGFLGASQASWVAAIVAGGDPGVRFLLIRSGPLTTPAEEGREDYLRRIDRYPATARARAARILELDDEVTRTGKGWDRLQTEIAEAANEDWFKAMDFRPLPPDHKARAAFRPWLDVDPRPLLEKSPAAALWIYGEADETVPARESATIASAMKAAGKDYRVVVIPGASHALTRPPPQDAQWPRLAPEYLPTVMEWFEQKVR
ncbi:MAG TPA: alpha/beta hydrolase [Caulobacteraceae bacterium]